MHSILPLLLAMVAAIVLLTMLANKIKVAYPIVLVWAGLLVSFVPGLPVLRINPDLIFFIFLPPLLFEAAWSVSFKEMRKWWRMIGSFAFLVVFFTAFAVAVFANHFIPGFSLALGFLLGGIVSPPDAVSTAAITKFVKIPRSTSAILEGESLLNDASSLIIFRFALVAVGTGQFIFVDAAQSFLWMVFGGAGIGLLLAWLIVFFQKRLPTDAPSDIAFTLITPYFLYWIAETVHSSGVLAVVSGGLYMANKRLLFLNSASRVQGYSVWQSFVFVLNGLVFLIIGLELPEIVEGLRQAGIPLSTAILYGVLVTGILIAVRIISSYKALVATYLFRRSVLPQVVSKKRAFMLPLVLGWTGMRGVVSLAAALAIPITMENGAPFPHRNLILFITFMVILLTLVIQGLTLPTLFKKLDNFRVMPERSEEEETIALRKKMQQHGLQFLKEKSSELPHIAELQKLKCHWEEKAANQDQNFFTPQTKLVYLELLENQRQFLNTENKTTNTPEDIIHQQVHLLDLEEERIRRI